MDSGEVDDGGVGLVVAGARWRILCGEPLGGRGGCGEDASDILTPRQRRCANVHVYVAVCVCKFLVVYAYITVTCISIYTRLDVCTCIHTGLYLTNYP